VELKLIVGDLVRHKKHGFYGIVLAGSAPYGQTFVCTVEWVESGRSHLIDINFLDKLNK